MKSTIWVLKRVLIVCLLALIIEIAAIFHSCIYGNNFITNFLYNNAFLHEVGYTVHAAKRPQVVVASPDKPKPKSKRVKQCFASNDGVKQCK